MFKSYDILFLIIVILNSILVACGSKESGDSSSADIIFPDSLLSEYIQWNPLFNGDQAFSSNGHPGQTVRVYFNQIAAPYFKKEKNLPFAEGSYIAKAVVTNASTSGLDAISVYFMKKMYDGYDSAKNNWAYANASLNNGKLEFQEPQGKLVACNACHLQAKEWDFVKTVDYFRKQSTN